MSEWEYESIVPRQVGTIVGVFKPMPNDPHDDTTDPMGTPDEPQLSGEGPLSMKLDNWDHEILTSQHHPHFEPFPLPVSACTLSVGAELFAEKQKVAAMVTAIEAGDLEAARVLAARYKI